MKQFLTENGAKKGRTITSVYFYCGRMYEVGKVTKKPKNDPHVISALWLTAFLMFDFSENRHEGLIYCQI
jgi:hypothetical protein